MEYCEPRNCGVNNNQLITSEHVLMPCSSTSHNLAVFGAPGMLTAMPTIAIGSCFGFFSPPCASLQVKSTLTPLQILNTFSVLLISPVPGPKLSRRMQRGVSHLVVEMADNASEREDTTRSQLTGWMRIMSTMASTSDPEA